MNNLNIKVYLAVGAIALIGGITFIIYLLFFAGKTTAPTQQSGYPQSVVSAINSPIEKNGDSSVLISNDTYTASYYKSSTEEFFSITLLAQPVVEVSQTAEQALLQKLGIQKEYACTLPILIKVPASVDENLWGYNFGMSFCGDRMHLSDKAQTTNTSNENNLR